MKNKLLFTILAVYSIILLSYHVNKWVSLQEAEYLQLKNLDMEGKITARKATSALFLDMQFKLMPNDVESKDFIPWCRSEGVSHVFWSRTEMQARPKLRDGKWVKDLEIIWNLPEFGFIGRVK